MKERLLAPRQQPPPVNHAAAPHRPLGLRQDGMSSILQRPGVTSTPAATTAAGPGIYNDFSQIPIYLDTSAPELTSAVPPIVHEVLQSHAQPLDIATRAFLEARFGHDFSQVRVHTDPRAA